MKTISALHYWQNGENWLLREMRKGRQEMTDVSV